MNGFRHTKRGFTLLELLVTLAVVGIISMIALPSFARSVAQAKLDNRAEQLANLFRFARSEAVRLNHPVIICSVLVRRDMRDRGVCDNKQHSSGWKAFADRDGDMQYHDERSPDLPLRTVIVNPPREKRFQLQASVHPIGGGTRALTQNLYLYPDGSFGIGKQIQSAYIRLHLQDTENRDIKQTLLISPSGNALLCRDRPDERPDLCQAE